MPRLHDPFDDAWGRIQQMAVQASQAARFDPGLQRRARDLESAVLDIRSEAEREDDPAQGQGSPHPSPGLRTRVQVAMDMARGIVADAERMRLPAEFGADEAAAADMAGKAVAPRLDRLRDQAEVAKRALSLVRDTDPNADAVRWLASDLGASYFESRGLGEVHNVIVSEVAGGPGRRALTGSGRPVPRWRACRSRSPPSPQPGRLATPGSGGASCSSRSSSGSSRTSPPATSAPSGRRPRTRCAGSARRTRAGLCSLSGGRRRPGGDDDRPALVWIGPRAGRWTGLPVQGVPRLVASRPRTLAGCGPVPGIFCGADAPARGLPVVTADSPGVTRARWRISAVTWGNSCQDAGDLGHRKHG